MAEKADNRDIGQRVSKLFEFLKAYVELKYPPIRNISQQLGVLWLDDLPPHPSIEMGENIDGGVINDVDSNVALRLNRPRTTECPRPPAELSEWLKPGWRDIDGEVDFHPTRNRVNADGHTRVEAFDYDRGRPTLLNAWRQQRDQWVSNERPAREALKFFQQVYEWFGAIEREGERIELLVGDGLV
ncbi:MAG: hypothetical protein K1X42_15575 [Opitutaceae bacterium]|nr:hypothetical protein [Opitutaceae bacterium]